MVDEKRRKKGDGSFSRKPNGTIVFRVQYGIAEDGKRLRKTFTGKSEAECRRKAKAFERELYEEKVVLQERTIGEWMNEWLETYVQQRVHPATYNNYLSTFKIILDDPISKRLLQETKPVDIGAFYKRQARYSLTIFKKLRYLLQAAFEAAIDNDLCYKNPVKHVDLPKKASKEHVFFSESDVKTIEAFAKIDGGFGIGILFMLQTGIRSGEIRALVWDDVDLKSNIVTVCKAIKGDQTLGTTKSGKNRVVPISEEFSSYLKSYIKNGKYVLGGNSYLSADSFKSKYGTFFRHLDIYCEENSLPKVPHYPPHTTRHTYASLLLKQGVNLKWVQMLLGHADIEMTSKYSHAEIDDLKKAVSGLNF